MTVGSEFLEDPDQQQVIRAPADSFLLVTTTSGAAKTAVACARIAWLARQGLPPASILMISFTRVAVAELRDRVERMAADVPDVWGVEITTLYSQAWGILKGLAKDKKVEELFGSYAANIETTAVKLGAFRCPWAPPPAGGQALEGTRAWHDENSCPPAGCPGRTPDQRTPDDQARRPLADPP